MIKISKNNKTNKFYNMVGVEILEFMEEAYINEHYNELERYMKEFSNIGDFNLYRYGNLSIYYEDIYKILEVAGYKIKNISINKLENMYISAIRYMAYFVSRRIRKFERNCPVSSKAMRENYCEYLRYLMNHEQCIN